MSFFTQASFVMDPNVYGDGKLYVPKPTDGSGDLTFTRASTGTRVNSAGLIEKVRTNFVLHSEDQTNGSYAKNPSIDSVTAVLNPITGENNAFKIVTNTGNDPYFYQNIYGISNGENTFSCWLWTDSGQSTEAVMFFYNSNGSEVYTKSVTLTTTPTRYDHLVNFSNAGPVTTVRIDLRQNGPSIQYIYTYGWQAESGVMTDYIPTTTSAVSVGPLANIPRLNYGSDGCPSLLLEPQRTNSLTYSEQFDNAGWSKGACTITANQIVSPSGYLDADLVTTSGTADSLQQSVSVTSGTAYTFSGFIKSGSADTIALVVFSSFPTSAGTYNLTNGTATSSAGSPVVSIQDYGNGWYRATLTATATSTGTANFYFASSSTDAVSTYHVWGAQLEAGSYATSYIPTLSAAVTRNADACYKTGISSLIGQTEGTFMIDFVASAQAQDGAGYSCITIFGNSTQNLQIYTNPATTLRWYAKGSVAFLFDETANVTLVAGQRYKIAYAYKSGDWALYVNGVQKRTRTETTIPAVSQFNFNTDSFGVGNAKVENKFNQALIFKTRLSNADLARLTSL